MRFKNFTLLFLLGIFGMFSSNLHAQQDASINPADIRYWIGEGSNEVVFIVNWAEPDTALAWGFRFSEETITVKEMMAQIDAADYRFTMDATDTYVSNLTFDDGYYQLNGSEYGFWMYNVNGEMAWEYYDTQIVRNGDYVKWGDTECGTIIDPENWVYVWEKEVVAVYPLAEDATIAPEEILYWVGEGPNEVVFIVNWAEPNIALAWGYRFSEESVLVKDVMDAIKEADGRFDYGAGAGMVDEIKFIAGDQIYALAGMWWMYVVNGQMAWYGYDEQTVVNGDYIKFGDESCATDLGHWNYVWETPVWPVSVNTSVNESASSLAMFPNPATSYTQLDARNWNANAVVTVSDLQGRILGNYTLSGNNEPVMIETSNYEAGVYFVTVSDATRCQTLKLVVK